ncbi:hypothetical protein tinsulaeT_37260 [Thalassotalea insulae]|uniref:Two-component system response regulator n=1 Tax=Thalassotalea insulae TaxID=2056778 RepID=A0ABQ6H0I2_9GAMM|nr:EAL domain-containing protein [Thalassotalea insulae]GLX80386.1 hypothetical protein tinsulaeT_37260 [Thalassotalea insulae]
MQGSESSEVEYPVNILIVDDQTSSILILEKAVENLAHIISTSQPEEVMSLVTQYQPCVILMDIELGDYNGIELAKEILQNQHLPDPAIVFITSSQASEIEYHSLYAGGVDFIHKPINIDICRLRVSNLIKTKTYASRLESTQRSLFQEKENLKVTLNSIGDGVIVTDSKGYITFINPIAEDLTGMIGSDALGQHIECVMSLRDATSGEKSINPAVMALQEKRRVAMALNCQLTSIQGQVYRVEDSAAPIFDDMQNLIGSVMVFHDISEAVAMSVKMNHLANNDHLTGLPNRILLHDRITRAIRISHSRKLSVGLLLVDIDHFKYLNETIGHQNGDLLIKMVATRLERLMDEKFTLSRVGGDEFAIVIPEMRYPSIASALASEIIEQMKSPFLLNHQEYTLSVSIGISISPTDADTEETLMRHADTAMFRAKKQGRNNICYFSDALEEELIDRIEIEKILRRAIEKDLVEIHFQPQVNLKNSEVIAVEALARLKDADGHYIPPLKFIELAEELHLIDKLGEQIFHKACQELKSWEAQGISIKLCINVSAKQFAKNSFVDFALAQVELHQIRTSKIELEITETTLMEDFDSVKSTLHQLTEAGFSIAIDDFGTGYSSLSYLKFFNVNILKIDQTFVKDMLSDEQSTDIVQTIITLGKSLNLTIIAEGIETLAHEEKLIELDCSMGQGYLYSKPLSSENFVKYLQTTMRP